MPATLIETNANERIAYDSVFLSDPTALGSLRNKLSLKIIKSLAESPACAIDIARRLKVHEQKIYYHLKNLEKAGIVYAISNERRQGMIAKIYSVVSPVIATKLFDKGIEVKENIDLGVSRDILNFLSPFVDGGKFNAVIIIGDSYSHGRFDASSTEGSYVLDFLIFLGRFIVNWEFPHFKIDVKVHNDDLKNNLILIGNNRTNSVIDKINDKLLINFDDSGKEVITSKISNGNYSDPRTGVIIKATNPFDETKKILILGGIGRRGIQASSLAVTKYLTQLMQSIKSFDDISKVVKGFDKDGDDVIDSIKILE